MARVVQFKDADGKRLGVNPEMVVTIAPGGRPDHETAILLVGGMVVTVAAEFNEVVGSLNNPPAPGPAELPALF